MINVKDPPTGFTAAKGNGVDDDQPALQALLDTKVDGEYLGALYFPAGRYRIDNPLVFGFRTGYHIIGSGLPKPVNDESPPQGAESVLVWGGADGGTMVDIQGAGLVWSGLGLWGVLDPALTASSSSSGQPRAQYGININKPTGKSGLGTGQMWFDSILIADCDEAISTASDQSANCDTTAFGYCWIESCNIGLHLTHQNAMEWTFQYIRANGVGTIFKANNGGKLFTQCVSVLSDNTTVLELLGGGKNNAYYHIGGVVIHENATDVTLLNNSPTNSGGLHSVRFTDGHLRNNVKLVVNREGDEGQGTARTTVELVGCRGVDSLEGTVGNVVLKGKDSSNRVVFFVRDCDVASIVPLIKTGTGNSVNYRAWGLDNWTFASGVVSDTTDEDP